MANPKEPGPEDSKLREAGFDSLASPDEALATLQSLRGRPGISDRAVARALGALRSVAAAETLAAMERESSGAARREIRRALFRLRQAGIVPSTAPAQSATATVMGGPAIEGMLSPIDATGVRLVWIMKTRARGGMIRLWGFTSEHAGLVGCSIGTLTRRELRRDREMVEQRAGVRMVEAAWPLCDFILCEASRHTPESKRGAVGNFLALRAEIIASPPAGDFVHPIYTELGAESRGEPSLELLKEPEVVAWRFPPETLKPYVDEIADLQSSVIVLNPMQQEERVKAVVEKAIAGLMEGGQATRTRRRLEDIAYYLARTDRRQAAGWAAAAAAKIGDGADLKRLAFFENFLRTMLGASIAEQQQKQCEEPRLIMTPAEAMRAQQARRR